MDPVQWQRVHALLEEAIALPAADRSAFLDRSCPDPDDRHEVEDLLRYHEGRDGFLDDGVGRAAAELLTADVLLPGQALGPYRILREVGRGGMGVVYQARDTRLDRDVAIKMLPPGFGDDARQRERLRQEARAAAAIAHPGIAHVYALEQDEHGAGYVVSEFVNGRTLREEMAEGPLAPSLAVATASQIASAAGAAHARGIVHRDLKPENVMRSVEGAIKILDFGLARVAHGDAGARLTLTGTTAGTPGYMAPEQLRGDDVGPGTDIFALGLMLQEMLTGRHPFTGTPDSATATMVRILEAAPTALPDAVRTALPGIDHVIARALAKRPDDRYTSMADLAAALEAVDRGDASAVLSEAAALSDQAPPTTATGWWQFHQAFVSFLYIAMLYPAWRLRGSPIPGWMHNLLFVSLVVAAALGMTLRLHWLFTARVHPGQLRPARRRARPWIRIFDWLMTVALLVTAGAALVRDEVWLAALFATVAASTTVAFLLIEPATTEATFGDEP
ncbi:MAG: serine/threonine-protein kinase [Vicinamibacterales bacterium]